MTSSKLAFDLRDIITLYPICSMLPKPVTAAKLVGTIRRCLVLAEEEP